MKERSVLKVVVLFVGSIAGSVGLVMWASDAFNSWELAAVVGAIAIVAVFTLAMTMAASDADNRLEVEKMRRDRDAEFDRLVADMWPEDSSDVRHGGLGR